MAGAVIERWSGICVPTAVVKRRYGLCPSMEMAKVKDYGKGKLRCGPCLLCSRSEASPTQHEGP